ncbi:hypothetical protein ACMD2_18410 [Ananas comosus]|uniref:Uncharacterized protein n=1 Tax=Ananas comosus TaxID=4615 RepID=A0A199W2L5_ANACO|nr:hypothetical protein ACMD2_18410 [Ananas comosus]
MPARESKSPLRIILVFHPQKLADLRVLGDHAVERDVPVLAPVRHPAVLEERHLLHLLQDVLVEPRHRRVVAAVVRDVEVEAVVLLAQVGGGGLDVAHEDAVVELDAAESLRVEVAELLDVLDEVFGFGQRDADSGLVEELAPHARVPRAGRQEGVVGAVEAASRGLDFVLEADDRVAREQQAVVGQAVASNGDRRRRQPRVLAPAVRVARGFQALLFHHVVIYKIASVI